MARFARLTKRAGARNVESFTHLCRRGNMNAAALPSYAALVSVIVIMANLGTGWLVLLSMGKSEGSVFEQGPLLLAVLSCIALALCYYNAIFPVELSFWGAAGLGALGLWGAWVDYTRLADRRKTLGKSGKSR